VARAGQKRSDVRADWSPDSGRRRFPSAQVANPPAIRDYSGRLGGKLDIVESGRVP
jgi:hypothetical protein